MIAILIFSFGVLGTMSSQANMVAQSTQTTYRLNASMYINSLVGAAQADPANFACYTYPASSAATNCTTANTYVPTWATAALTMPGSAANPPTSIYNTTANTLTVTVYWKLPQDKSTDPAHSVSATIQPVIAGT